MRVKIPNSKLVIVGDAENVADTVAKIFGVSNKFDFDSFWNVSSTPISVESRCTCNFLE